MSSVKQRVPEIGSVDTLDETDEDRMEWARRHPQLAALVEPRNARLSEAETDSMANLLDSASSMSRSSGVRRRESLGIRGSWGSGKR
ncbi:hypothetical protein MMC16_006616 [Acarospora aff. strigata]|nr:hypothetical protein [Acarospora aff. strigata]